MWICALYKNNQHITRYRCYYVIHINLSMFSIFICTTICTKKIGSIWRSFQKFSNKSVVVKVTKRELHHQSVTIENNRKILIHENIIKEKKNIKIINIK